MISILSHSFCLFCFLFRRHCVSFNELQRRRDQITNNSNELPVQHHLNQMRNAVIVHRDLVYVYQYLYWQELNILNSPGSSHGLFSNKCEFDENEEQRKEWSNHVVLQCIPNEIIWQILRMS